MACKFCVKSPFRNQRLSLVRAAERSPMKKSGIGYAFKLIGISFLISLLISAAVIFIANDVFAFVSDSGEHVVTIPEDATADDVSAILKEKGLIRFPFIYQLYASMRSWGDDYLAGEFVLSDAMSYDELRYALSPRRGVRSQIKVTIPEGYTTDEIISLFVSLGIGTPEGFADVIENGGNFGYDFVAEIPEDTGRRYRLDGYLFPDTDLVYADSTETEIITKLLANFNVKFDEELREKAAQAGYTIDEIVRLASIVEKEAYYAADMAGIASVFRNRMSSSRYPFLESDATVKYAKVQSGNEEMLTAEDLRSVDSPYNTYLYRGLPPGAICSPGLAALQAAVYPADTGYYYFVSAKDKTTIFSRTYEEHLRAVAGLK